MYSINKSEVLDLSYDLAKTFREMEKVPGERPLKSARLKYFEDLINAGTFADPTWSQGICKEDGKIYRLDGQHTSTQLAATPPDLWATKLVDRHVQITTYHFDSIEADAPALFNKFDNPASVRSNGDMMSFYMSGWNDLADVSSEAGLKTCNGIYDYEMTKKKGDRVIYPPRVRGFYFRNAEYRMFTNWLNGIFQSEGVRLDWLFGKSGVVAEMLADWKMSNDAATIFWLYVVRENHPDVDHISRQLGEDFKKWRAKPERHTQSQYRSRAMRAWIRFQKEHTLASDPMSSSAGLLQFEQQPSA